MFDGLSGSDDRGTASILAVVAMIGVITVSTAMVGTAAYAGIQQESGVNEKTVATSEVRALNSQQVKVTPGLSDPLPTNDLKVILSFPGKNIPSVTITNLKQAATATTTSPNAASLVTGGTVTEQQQVSSGTKRVKTGTKHVTKTVKLYNWQKQETTQKAVSRWKKVTQERVPTYRWKKVTQDRVPNYKWEKITTQRVPTYRWSKQYTVTRRDTGIQSPGNGWEKAGSAGTRRVKTGYERKKVKTGTKRVRKRHTYSYYTTERIPRTFYTRETRHYYTTERRCYFGYCDTVRQRHSYTVRKRHTYYTTRRTRHTGSYYSSKTVPTYTWERVPTYTTKTVYHWTKQITRTKYQIGVNSPGSRWSRDRPVGTKIIKNVNHKTNPTSPGSGWTKEKQVGTTLKRHVTKKVSQTNPGAGYQRVTRVGTKTITHTKMKDSSSNPGDGWLWNGYAGTKTVTKTKMKTAQSKPGAGWTNVGFARTKQVTKSIPQYKIVSDTKTVNVTNQLAGFRQDAGNDDGYGEDNEQAQSHDNGKHTGFSVASAVSKLPFISFDQQTRAQKNGFKNKEVEMAVRSVQFSTKNSNAVSGSETPSMWKSGQSLIIGLKQNLIQKGDLVHVTVIDTQTNQVLISKTRRIQAFTAPSLTTGQRGNTQDPQNNGNTKTISGTFSGNTKANRSSSGPSDSSSSTTSSGGSTNSSGTANTSGPNGGSTNSSGTANTSGPNGGSNTSDTPNNGSGNGGSNTSDTPNNGSDDNFAPVAVATHSGSNTITGSSTHITLDGTASSDPDGDSLSYVWTLTNGPRNGVIGLGSDQTSATDGVTITKPGWYTFTLRVSDDHGNHHSDTTTVVVTSTSKNTPTATISGPSTALITHDKGDSMLWTGIGPNSKYSHLKKVSESWCAVGHCPIKWNWPNSPTAFGRRSLTFTASANDLQGGPLSYQWSVDNVPQNTHGKKLSHSFSKPGRHTVTVTITDSNGRTTSTSHTILIQELPDRIHALELSSTQNPVVKNKYKYTVTFDNLATSPATVQLTFSDGVTKTLNVQNLDGRYKYRATVTRSYTTVNKNNWWREKGQKQITATAKVTTSGDSDSVTHRKKVTTYELKGRNGAVRPTLASQGSTTITAGEQVSFRIGWQHSGTNGNDGSGNVVPNSIQQGTPVTINFGDGSSKTINLLTPTTVTHTYSKAGSYSATVTMESTTVMQGGNPFAGKVDYTTNPVHITVKQKPGSQQNTTSITTSSSTTQQTITSGSGTSGQTSSSSGGSSSSSSASSSSSSRYSSNSITSIADNLYSGASNTVADTISGAANTVGNVASGTESGIPNTVRGAANAVSNTASSIGSRISNTASSIGNGIGNAWDTLTSRGSSSSPSSGSSSDCSGWLCGL